MHIQILAVFFFLVGSSLHILAQVDSLARMDKTTTRMLLLAARWETILIRTCWAFAFFAMWLEGQLIAVLTAASIPIPAAASKILDLHVSGAVAFMAGYLFDSALGYIPFLKSSVPPAIDTVDPPKE